MEKELWLYFEKKISTYNLLRFCIWSSYPHWYMGYLYVRMKLIPFHGTIEAINNPRSLAKVCGEPLYSKHTQFLRETPINSLLY